MSYIELNDILEELLDENKRLFNELLFANNCLTKFIEFKSFIEIVFNKVNNYLEPNDCRKFKDLNEDIEKTFDGKRINNFNQTKCRINFQCEENSETNASVSEEPISDDIHISEDYETQQVLENLDNNLMNNVIKVKSEEYCNQVNSDEDTDDYEPGQLFDFSDRSETSDEDIDRRNNSLSKLRTFRTKGRTIGKVGQKVHSCDEPECNFTARSRCELKEHQMCVHSDETPYVCEVPGCGKAFKITRYLKKHMRNSHLGLGTHTLRYKGKVLVAKKFQCDYPGCSYRAARSDYVKRTQGSGSLYRETIPVLVL